MNQIVDENAIIEGRAPESYWNVAHSDRIEGFATDMSVDAGARIDFKINVNDLAGSDYKVEVFRLGYYGGDGAREVAEWTNTNATVQADALYDATRGLVDAGNWSVTDSWQVPEGAVSGVYLVRLQRLDADGHPIEGATNQIPFVVRDDGATHDIVLQTSDTTWQAYNGWGGNNGQVGANLYGDPSGTVDWDPIEGAGPHSQDRAYAVSYNRPIITDTGASTASGAQDYLFGADYAAIQWLEKNGYDVAYISGVDTDRLGADYLKNYAAFISVGHDEYWSGDQRANVTEARDAGVNLLFWSGNEMYWKTRWDVSISADGTEYRTLVCYKETLAVADPNAGPEDYVNLDPTDTWTGTWRDIRFLGNPSAGGGDIADVDPITGLCPYCHCGENSLTGQLFGPDGTGQFGGALDVPAEYAALRVWRDTTVADGGQLDIAPGILGYEWDTSPDDLLRPAGLVKLSGTTIPWDGILVDQGNTVAAGTATHNLSLYRAESGALVFGAGTTFWSWGLSDAHASSPYGAQIATTDLQQFTINMFADMGIQPGVSDAFLISQGLTRATVSADHVAATAAIDTLPAHAAALSPVTITGTATDDDGNSLTADGKVAVVEVSTDGGATWRVATTSDGWAHWSYTWQPAGEGTYTVKARAIDDSLNVATVVTDSETVTVAAPDSYNFFNGVAPKSGTTSLYNDHTAVELGMHFTVDRAGEVTELKYWRSSLDADDTDVREGHLWRADGTLLATVTFTSAPGQAGWQVATLTTPISLTAGLEYVVSYVTHDNYVASNDFFGAAREAAFDGLDNASFWGPYGVIRSAQDSNGVFAYDGGVPSQSYGANNYWLDLTFDPADAAANHAPSITTPASFASPENRTTVGTIAVADADGNAITYAIAGGADAARFTIDAQTGLLSFVQAPDFELPLDAGGDNVYQVTVSVSDGIAAAVTKALTVTVTVADVDESGAPSHVFASGATPAVVETGEATDYELGMRFQSNAAGTLTELLYYRGTADAGDTDTRTLNLWTAAGERLGQVTVTSTAGASGWQVGTLATPIAIAANTTYVVSYGTTQNYAYTSSWFASAHASSDGVLSGLTGNNGVFAAGTTGAFPTASYNSTNYWVDVTFDAAANHAPSITTPASFASPENRTTVGTIAVADADGNAITYAIAGGADAARFTIDAQTGLLSFVQAPDFELPLDAGGDNVYQVTVSVSDGIAAAVTKALTVTVADVDESGAPSHVFASGATPAVVETGEATDYELGMRFQSNAAGTLTELLYYRGTADAGDTDTRTLNLWTAAGERLGQVTVTSTAGASGWQVGTLATPIAIAANTTYVVSYGTTQNYAYTSSWFASAHASSDGVLSGLTGNNGVFAAGTTGAFPTASYNATNYWVDVTFLHALPNAPAFAGSAAFSAAENQTLAGTVAALDADGDALAYAIAGGADADLFTIEAATGVLRFRTAPDHEAPADVGGDNVYNLVVSVSDGILAAVERAITVTVTDVAENRAPTVAAITAPTTHEDAPPVQIDLLAGASDPDGDALGVAGPVTVTSSNAARTVTATLGAGGVLILDPSQFGDLVAGQSETVQIAYAISDGVDPAVAGTATIVVEGRDEALTLTGTSAANLLTGAGNDDLIRGLASNDTLRGLGGNDTLDGGAGTDSISGGDGNDVILVRASEAQTDTIAGDAGVDTLRNDAAADLVLNGTAAISGVEVLDAAGYAIRGTAGGNVLDLSGFATITGLAGLFGLDNNDTLAGSAFADTLNGGTGNDSLIGGGGDDTFVIRGSEAQGDTMAGGAGLDRILIDTSGTDAVISTTARLSDIEAIDGAGLGIRGTTGANLLDFTGMRVSNVAAISGLEGNDTLAGGTGDDVLVGGAGSDSFVFRFGAATGDDRITDFDASGDDVIRLAGYGATAASVAAATSFDAGGAFIDLHLVGGDGTIRLAGVAGLSFTTEDFILT